jgi:excisionase family DNA binding protein
VRHSYRSVFSIIVHEVNRDRERRKTMSENTSIQVEGLSISEACRLAGIGKTRLYGAIADGRLTARKFGKRTLILRTDLLAFLADLPVAN